MSTAAGRDMRVNIKTDEDVFITFAGLKTKTLSLRSKPVDATDSASVGGWQNYLSGAGLKSASLNGEGVFTGAVSSQLARAAFFAQSVRVYQFIMPEFGCVEGPFLISELTYKGARDGVAFYDITLLSSGEPVFTPTT